MPAAVANLMMAAARRQAGLNLSAYVLRGWSSWPFLLLASAGGWMAGIWLPQAYYGFGVVRDLYFALLDVVALPLILVLILFCMRQLRDIPDRIALITRVVLSTLLLVAAIVMLTISWMRLFAPGASLSTEVLTGLGKLLVAAEAPVSSSLLSEAAVGAPDAFFSYSHVLGATSVFGALVQEHLLEVMLIAASGGLAMALLDREKTQLFDDIVETSYRALTRLVFASNYLLPVATFAATMHMAMVSSETQLAALLCFLLPFLSVALLLVSAALIYLSVRTKRPLSLVLLTLRDSAAVALVGGSLLASVSLAIESMSERLGVRRFSTALSFPFAVLLMRPGTALFLAMLTVFVAQVYGLSLTLSDLAVVTLVSMLMAFISTDLHGRTPSWNFGLLMLYLGLPLDFTVMLSVALEPFVSAVRNLINVMAACVIAAWVSEVQRDCALDQASRQARAWMLTLSFGQVLVLLSGVLLCGGLIVLLGVGFGARL